jgi:hypothetical protein
LISLATLILFAAVFWFYASVGFSEPYFDKIVSEICGDLYESRASELALEQCRSEGAITYRGMQYMWFFGLPSFLLWLSIPLISFLSIKNFTIKSNIFLNLIYIILVFFFYLFWIKKLSF